jgi:hypothetical protein
VALVKKKHPLVFAALKRRPEWPSIEQAASVRPTPFFATWHPEVFDLWLSHALVPLPSGDEGSVQLATPKWGEAAVFAETEGLGQGWDKLPELRVPVGFVMAGVPTATQGEEATREMVWRAPICANEIFSDAGHLVSNSKAKRSETDGKIVQEKPDELADAIARFIGNLLLPAPENGKL